ncbi:hypothetical protein HYU22_05520 [Candidatus Woesearchaeota archaeon]|nr:hypothetical protein [Candidatus Woesearchaeota archaeon]
MEISFIIGVMGMLLVLLAFVLDEFVQKFNQDTMIYNIINILGSGMLLYYAFSIRSWPFIVLNTVWLIAALVKSAELLRHQRG